VQKFTRPLTREIELAGERLALTFTAEGISVRPVGSRKPPREATWATVLHCLAGSQAAPSPEDVAGAVRTFKGGGSTKTASAPAKAAEPAPTGSEAGGKDKAEAGGQDKAEEGELAGVLERLGKWLAAHRSRYAAALAPGASAADLDGLQAAIGRPLPADLRKLLAWHNGQKEDFAGAFEGGFRLMSTRQIAEAKQQLDAEAGEDGWQPAWIPFLEDDSGDYVVVEANQPGAPVREFWLGRTDHPVVAPSLAAWLTQFAKAVEAGGYVEDPERGEFLRKRS
jgi:cell wall assembly regulator SMI1